MIQYKLVDEISLNFPELFRKTPDNMALKIILCNFTLILLGQHYTGQNSMQYCSTGSKQHCIRKDPVQFCLSTLGTTLDRLKSYTIISERLQAIMHKKKFCAKLS